MTTNYVANGSGQIDITAADQSWVLNSGFTMLSNGSAFLVDAAARIFNYGGIVSLSSGGAYFKTAGGYLLNGTTGSITGFDGVVMDGTSPQAVDVINFGMIVGTDFYGVAVGGSRYLNFDNRGYCYGEVNALIVYSSALSTVRNFGVMESHTGPVISIDTTSTEHLNLSNYGDIRGDIFVTNCAQFFLVNTGTMGDLVTHGHSVITNTGTMGAVNAAGDTYVTNAGTMGDYTGGADYDDVQNSGIMGMVRLGDGDDSYAASGSASSIQVLGGIGNDNLSAGRDGQYFGEQGNDIYGFLDASSIAEFNETGGTGKDTVASVADFNLSGSHVVGKIENLILFFDAVTGIGNGLNNAITGNDKNNVLNGLGGKDILTGGAGADDLTGGVAADRFTYNAITESGPAAAGRDTIEDFVHGTDKIDVHHIDADATTNGNQAFTFGGGFTAGHISASPSGGDMVISFNTDGDGAAEMVIVLKNFAGTIDAGDFLA